MDLLQIIKNNAKKLNQRIVLPESFDERILKAADIAIEENLAQIILIGDPEKVNADAEKLCLKNIGKA